MTSGRVLLDWCHGYGVLPQLVGEELSKLLTVESLQVERALGYTLTQVSDVEERSKRPAHLRSKDQQVQQVVTVG